MAPNKNKKQKQAHLRIALSNAQDRVAIEEKLAGTKRTREEEEQNKRLDKKRSGADKIQDGGDAEGDLGDLLDGLGNGGDDSNAETKSTHAMNAVVLQADSDDGDNAGDTMDENRLVQQALSQAEGKLNKRRKYTPTDLKRALRSKLGPQGGEGASGYWLLTDVDTGTGHSPYPVYLTEMKGLANTVPVPSHWSLKRAFLCRQINREVSSIVPKELEATGVRQIREANTSKPNLIPFARCFLSGSPLKLKRFGVEITAPGDIFYENKWKPKRVLEVGKLSDALKKALGMGPLSPPPWLHAFQRMRELPPSYPNIKVPGYNAPIPVGASWGPSEGQWGQAPRNGKGDFLFPEVGDTGSSRAGAQVSRGQFSTGGIEQTQGWGDVPPRRARTQATDTSVTPPAANVPVPVPGAPPSQPQVRPSAANNVVQPDEFLRDHGEKDLTAVGEKLFSRRLTKQKALTAPNGDDRDVEMEMMLGSFNQVYGSNQDQQHATNSLLSDSRSYLNRI